MESMIQKLQRATKITSVVATVAVSSVSIFSGLVNANLSSGSGSSSCRVRKNQFEWSDGGRLFHENNPLIALACVYEGDNCINQTVKCGKFYKLDNGQAQIDADGKPIIEDVILTCNAKNPDSPDMPDFKYCFKA